MTPILVFIYRIYKMFTYWLFNPTVYNRTIQFKEKKRNRIIRVKSAMAEMNRYKDIPLSWQLSTLCKILKIKPSESASRFLTGLNFGNVDVKKEARKLPLI